MYCKDVRRGRLKMRLFQAGLRRLLAAFEEVCPLDGDKFEIWAMPVLIALKFKIVYENWSAVVMPPSLPQYTWNCYSCHRNCDCFIEYGWVVTTYINWNISKKTEIPTPAGPKISEIWVMKRGILHQGISSENVNGVGRPQWGWGGGAASMGAKYDF